MLSKILPPKTKADLIQSITKANVHSFAVYEGDDLNRLPSKFDLIRSKASVVILKFR